MRIMVLGCGGMLGDYVYKHFTSKGHSLHASDLQPTDAWCSHLDIRDGDRVRRVASLFCPDVIMNLAADTDLEHCERNESFAIGTNTQGSANCALVASRLNIPYVYISTAGIFDGSKEYYSDWEKPNPLCVYGKTKYWGELVASTYEKGIILRCGWQMGSGHKDKKFINKIWKQIKDGSRELYVVKDKQGTPTYVKDFTLQIERLLEARAYGVWNAVCKGEATRFDVAQEFVKLLGLDVKVTEVSSDYFAKEYFAPRPASEKLITSYLDFEGLNVMRPWQEALAEYVHEWKDYFTL